MSAYAVLVHAPQIIWVTGLGLWGLFGGPKVNLRELLSRSKREGEDQKET